MAAFAKLRQGETIVFLDGCSIEAVDSETIIVKPSGTGKESTFLKNMYVEKDGEGNFLLCTGICGCLSVFGESEYESIE